MVKSDQIFGVVFSLYSRPGFCTGELKNIIICLICILIIRFLPAACHVAHALTDPTQLPLLHIDEFHYLGAFRLPDDTFGVSSLNYSEGPLEYDFVQTGKCRPYP
jgi:hypothetical protein